MPPISERLLRSGMRIFYKLLYHRMAWTYDLVAAVVSTGHWREWVYAVQPYLDGPRLLELGHGPGHLQALLLGQPERYPGVLGLDRSPQMGRMALGRLRRAGLAPKLANAQAQRLPFASASFDQAVATFPTEYIVDPLTLAEVWRVLAPGGRLVVLPLAYITGRRLPERLAAGLFRLTGQAPAWDARALLPYQQAGFETRAEWVELKASTVIFIVAQKGQENERR
jgi:ubiquinone/menaquinone biosynthesis C-methylase UbiE